jgi:hypothetical protein
MSGGELLEIRLLDNHLLDTFGSKSTARHKIDQLLESSYSWLNWIQAVDKKTDKWSTLLSSVTYKLEKAIFYL